MERCLPPSIVTMNMEDTSLSILGAEKITVTAMDLKTGDSLSKSIKTLLMASAFNQQTLNNIPLKP
jgi:hypothetical protein